MRPKRNMFPADPVIAREAAKGDTVEDDMTTRFDHLPRRMTELGDNMLREEGRRPRISPVPDRQTEDGVSEHNATHTLPKPWWP